MGKRWKDGYSASVELYVLVGDKRFGVAQVGPSFFVLKDQEVAIPPGTDGRLVIIIDGREKSYPIFMQRGALAGCDEVAYL
ncbi:MAG TPA: hypothetical protein VHY91_25615 [Pirellulales bacterium]|jgi:hypothetical protein|nr:hypothetical protein [Pirellulales bacterium]